MVFPLPLADKNFRFARVGFGDSEMGFRGKKLKNWFAKHLDGIS